MPKIIRSDLSKMKSGDLVDALYDSICEYPAEDEEFMIILELATELKERADRLTGGDVTETATH